MGFGAPFALLWIPYLVQTVANSENEEGDANSLERPLVAFRDVKVFAPDDAIAELKILSSDADAINDIAHQAHLGVKLRLSDAPWDSKEARPRCICKRIAVWDPFRDGLSKNVVMEMHFYSGAYDATKLKEVVAAMATKPGVKRHEQDLLSTLTTSLEPVRVATDADARSKDKSRMPLFFLSLGLACMVTGVLLGVCASGKRRQLVRQTCGSTSAHTRGVHCVTLLEDDSSRTVNADSTNAQSVLFEVSPSHSELGDCELRA